MLLKAICDIPPRSEKSPINGLYYPHPVSTFIGQESRLRRQRGVMRCLIFWHRECCAFTSASIERLKLSARAKQPAKTSAPQIRRALPALLRSYPHAKSAADPHVDTHAFHLLDRGSLESVHLFQQLSVVSVADKMKSRSKAGISQVTEAREKPKGCSRLRQPTCSRLSSPLSTPKLNVDRAFPTLRPTGVPGWFTHCQPN